MKEKVFQQHILRYARNKGWLCYHPYDSRRSVPGYPDLVLVRDRVLFREVKTDKGRLTEHQEAWGNALIEAGADYDVWRPSMIKSIYKELA